MWIRNFQHSGINIFLKVFFLAVLVVAFANHLAAQQTAELSDIRIDELSNDQIRSFALQAAQLGYSDVEIERFAKARGLNPIELAKFKTRLQVVRQSLPKNQRTSSEMVTRSISRDTLPEGNVAATTPFQLLHSPKFGENVFRNPSISFEPSLRLPTPAGYVLAADDELLIDISGVSDASYQLKVTPEGSIRIPNVGPVFVNGLTIEQARARISSRLAQTIYRNIRNGSTRVNVSLGSIRSIKVTIIGEATVPGTYTLPSLASAYNALYASGGPSENGSFRNIEVVRNNKVVAKIDVYQYLLYGQKSNNIRLQDQDVIRIQTYSTRVELKGQVKKPGLYDVLKGETLADIIEYAGGLTDLAYTGVITMFSNSNKDRQVSTIREADISSTIPRRGDTYIIGQILNRFSNRISIEGAVYRPGEFELKPGMTLKQLIEVADGIREDAFLNRGNIHRLKADLSPENVSFDPGKIISGVQPDIVLQKEDRIRIFSKIDLKEGYFVSIDGEVANPGPYLFEDSLTIQDLVLLAGGFKESATVNRIEVSRRIKDADTSKGNATTTLIFQQDIPADMGVSKASVFLLSPFDEVSIRPAPGYFVQRNVVIEGEIRYPGKYSLAAKTDKISDIIKRAGGLTAEAYAVGAVLVRSRKSTMIEKANREEGFNNLVRQNFQSGASPALIQQDIVRNNARSSDNVGIKLEDILDEPGTELDLLLNDGDTLRVPKRLETVRVNGEVLYPNLVRYDDSYRFHDYVSNAGGFSDRSARKRAYVVYANGAVRATRSFLFFKNYPKVKPGAEVFVPTKRERERLRPFETISLAATVVTMAAILINVIRK